MTKICNTCNTDKPLIEFYKKHSRCKSCTKIHYKENKEEKLKQSKIYYQSTIDEARRKRREYYEKNKELLRPKMDKWKKENIDLVKEINKNWMSKNREIRNKLNRERYYENWVEYRSYYNEYKKMRKKEPLYKLKHNISCLIRESLKNKGIKKNGTKSSTILGCSIEYFRTYLESKFESWMTWENYGKYNGHFNYGWDLDHIEPISSAKTEEESFNLSHYSNFQPLCSKINRDIKSSKINFNISEISF